MTNTFKKKYYTSQIDENDCGIACLAMILKTYNSSFSLAYLRNLAKTEKDGTSIFGLIKAAEKVNFTAKAIKADKSLLYSKDLPFPFIAHVIKNGSILHYYVITKVDHAHVSIADPAPDVGIKKIPIETFLNEWTGIAIFFAPEITYKPVKQEKNSLFSFFPGLLKQKKIIINIILGALLSTIISITGSYFLQTIIDTYIPNNMKNTLSIISIGLIVFYIFQSIFTYSQEFLLAILGQRLSIDIILGYIKHIFTLPIEFFATRNIGEIVSRFTDANKIIDALASTIISIFLDLGIVVIMGTILAIQSTKLFFITLISLPVYIIVITAFVKPFEKLNQKEMESNAILSSSIIEDIRGIETVKALNGEQQRFSKIDSEFVDYLKKSLSYTKADISQQSIKTLIELVLNVFILWIGAKLVIANQLSVGQLMTYNALLSYFVSPLQNIINIQTKLQSAKVANNRLNDVYLVQSEFEHKRPIKSFNQLRGNIKINNVFFKYGYGKDILKNINLTIGENEKLTIVGMSGSGKSTLVKLLVNFFEPYQGEITINNYPLNSINKHVLRSLINYIPQNPYIFSGTILENLKLGNRKGIEYNDIISACKIAMINKDIEKMPLQFRTILDENGSILSGGQRQRLSIARALLFPAEILIFDESTSGLDAITERKLVDNLLKLKDKTIIFIAHRLAIAKRTDNIIVLDNGKIVEKGNHNQLLSKKGYYYNLVTK